MLAPEICAVGWAYAEGKLSEFEVALLKQLGRTTGGAIGRQGHDDMVTSILGLVATGSGMDGAKLLHDRAPNLFPGESKIRKEYAKERRPPMLRRNLIGLWGETLEEAFKAAKEHFEQEGYDGPLVAAHDSTAVKPVAEARAVIVEGGRKMIQIDCFSSGPVRLANSLEGAQQLTTLMGSTEHKAVLATLMMLVPACADTNVAPFSLFLVAGGGPNTLETETWEDRLIIVGLSIGLQVWLQGADGCIGPRTIWLRRHVVLHSPHFGGKSERYRESTHVTLAEGERAVIVSCSLISFVVVERWITFTDSGTGHSRRGLVWQLLGPDDPHGNKKAHNQLHALQRQLAMGMFLAVITDLYPLAAFDGYTELHRNDLRVPDKQSEILARRVLSPTNASMLRELDANDAANLSGLGRFREGTATFIDFNAYLARATDVGYVPLEERVELATAALAFHLFWRADIVTTRGYSLNEHFVSDGHYHDLILRACKVLTVMPVQALCHPDLPFTPDRLGEKPLEETFGDVRAGSSGCGADRMFGMATLRDRLRRAIFRRQSRRTAGVSRRESQLPSLGAELERLEAGMPRLEQLQRVIERFSTRGFQRACSAVQRLDMANGLIEQGFLQLESNAPAMGFRLSVMVGPTAPPIAPPPTAPAATTALPTIPTAPPIRPAVNSPANEDENNDEDDDATGVPIGLMAAAADDIVEAATAGETIDDNLIQKVLLRFLDEGDLQETVLRDQDVLESSVAAATARMVQNETGNKRRTWHIFHNGRLWQWTALVRSLDGYIKVTDRGRAARFWNVMAAHYQSAAAREATRAMQTAAQVTADAADEEVGDVEDGGVAAVALESRLTPGSFAAVWRPTKLEADVGRLEIVRVRELLVRGPKAGYRVQEEMDISSKDSGWLKGDLLALDPETGHIKSSDHGVRFIRVSSADVIQPVHVQSTGQPGVLQLVPAEHDALAAREPELRAAAGVAARDRAAAKQRTKGVADEVRRVAGQTDMSKLTVDLIKEELRARRARGEAIPRLGDGRAEALEILAAARHANPNIPAQPPAATIAPAAPTNPSPATGQVGATGAELVGRCVMATFLDEEGTSQWYPSLIVEYRPRARIYSYVIHFEDGEEILVGLPDDTVQLLTRTVTHCKCPRCLLSDHEGRFLA